MVGLAWQSLCYSPKPLARAGGWTSTLWSARYQVWRPPTDDLYALLGVPRDADRATIQRAWRKRMRHVHPDGRPEHEKDQAHQEAARLNDALHILTDSSKRLDYDLSRRQSAAGTNSSSENGSARPRPEPPPPPRPPRVVVVKPQVVDFGSVAVGEIPPDQVVTVCFSDGSTIRYAWVLNDHGDFWQVVEPQPYRDVSAVTLRLRARPMAAHDGLGPRQDRLRLMIDDLIVVVPVCINVVAPAPPPPPPRPTPPRRPAPPPRRPTPPRRPAPTPPRRTPPPKPPAPRLTLANWRNFRLTCLGLFMLLSVLLLLGSVLFSGVYMLLHAAP
ncbi:J domain-containing protein [Streptomyces sp. NPDC054945]